MKKVAIVNADGYIKENMEMAMDQLMRELGFNEENPFYNIIKPGMTVFIKPNWVASRWRASCNHVDTLYSVITHPAVIEAVADRVAKALDGKGEIIIGDNPSIDADFEELMAFTNIKKLESKYVVPCKILDLRPLFCDDLKNYGIKDKMKKQEGDPLGEVTVDMGRQSMFAEMDAGLFRGIFNEREDTIAVHSNEKHCYTFSKSLYDADVYISIPKLKTHQKVGATLNLKGIVGCISQKNQLPHWRIGSPETGGDEYPDIASIRATANSKVTHRGAHPMNDTLWRMVVDIYLALRKKERRYFTIVDGIVSGEGQGPFCPKSKMTNVLIGGEDLLAVDIVSTRLMGLDSSKIKYLNHFLASGEIQYSDIEVLGNFIGSDDFFESESRYLDFTVPDQWKGIKI